MWRGCSKDSRESQNNRGWHQWEEIHLSTLSLWPQFSTKENGSMADMGMHCPESSEWTASRGRLLQGLPQLQIATHPQACPSNSSPQPVTGEDKGIKAWPFQPNIGQLWWAINTLELPVVLARLCSLYCSLPSPPAQSYFCPSLPQVLTLHKYPVHQTPSQHPLLRNPQCNGKQPPRAFNYSNREGYFSPILVPSSMLALDLQVKYFYFNTRLSHFAEVSPVISWLHKVHPLTDLSTRAQMYKSSWVCVCLKLFFKTWRTSWLDINPWLSLSVRAFENAVPPWPCFLSFWEMWWWSNSFCPCKSFNLFAKSPWECCFFFF